MLLTILGSVLSVGGKVICTVADVAGKILVEVIHAGINAEAAQSYSASSNYYSDGGAADSYDYSSDE